MLKDYKFKLKGVGPITFHLGCDFGRDPDGTMWFGPRKYAQCMLETYKMLFVTEPKKATSPLEKNDHPELNDSPELLSEDASKYQSMIGASQWLITLGRLISQLQLLHCCASELHLDKVIWTDSNVSTATFAVSPTALFVSELKNRTILSWSMSNMTGFTLCTVMFTS